MCGRYVNTRSTADLLVEFQAMEAVSTAAAPSWNVAPTTEQPIIVKRPIERGQPKETAVRQLHAARWGLVPSWVKDIKIGNKFINARSETITQSPAFKAAAMRRRCLVPADGYYEWEKTDDGKIPYYLHARKPLAFAGLYELWPDPALDHDDPDRWLWSYTVLTTTATDALGHIHDRSPVVLPAALYDRWLDPLLTDKDEVAELLGDVPEPKLHPRRVSTAVNSVKHDGPELIEQVK
jgi:putative SOS response-associated peptidase YedK